jgi:plastocyanin
MRVRVLTVLVGVMALAAVVPAASAEVLTPYAIEPLPSGSLDDNDPDKGHPERPFQYKAQRFVPKAAGTEENMRLWFGPYPVAPGHDGNRVDLDLPLQDGYIIAVEPHMRRIHDISEPSHQEAHIHHAHWFALDPGNEEDNYTGGNTEWIFGNGDEETRADFSERSAADPTGPIYGQYVGAGGPQLMIYMLHNKTNQPLNVWIVLDVKFVHGTKTALKEMGGRPFHDITGVLFGRTFDVPRKPNGPGHFSTTKDMEKPIEWVATQDGTMIGTGGHLHPGGTTIRVENLGSKENPCPATDGGPGTKLLQSDAAWRDNIPFSEDFQMEVSDPAWRAPVRKGDVIRITGYYENKEHAWYTAMTHEGIYIDELQPPVGRCAPYLINKPTPQGKSTRVKKKIVTYKRKKVRGKGGKVRIKRVKVVRTKWVKKKLPGKPVDPTEGVLNRPWGEHKDRICGEQFGAMPCDRAEPERPAGAMTGVVHIANFVYMPGDRSLSGEQGAPPRVKQGTSMRFVNEDQVAGIRHSVTTCTWPCNGLYVANYPLADGVWDSTTLGYDFLDGGNPNPVAETPKDLAVGKYSYFCRIHPWMRGAFEVVP